MSSCRVSYLYYTWMCACERVWGRTFISCICCTVLIRGCRPVLPVGGRQRGVMWWYTAATAPRVRLRPVGTAGCGILWYFDTYWSETLGPAYSATRVAVSAGDGDVTAHQSSDWMDGAYNASEPTNSMRNLNRQRIPLEIFSRLRIPVVLVLNYLQLCQGWSNTNFPFWDSRARLTH